jgi:3-deoxy-D-manno-octulosonate 8-phosphate phosphatase (KDO 8-P phosphatase)
LRLKQNQYIMNSPINKIKLLTLDVDGVLTDGGVYLTETGDVFKKFNVKDGMGIRLAIEKGVHVAFVSSAKRRKILDVRAKMVGVKLVYAGDAEKLDIVKKWCEKLKIDLEEVAHIADDVNDLKLMNAVGISACPVDAVDKVHLAAKVVLKTKGGYGCVREFIDKYIV